MSTHTARLLSALHCSHDSAPSKPAAAAAPAPKPAAAAANSAPAKTQSADKVGRDTTQHDRTVAALTRLTDLPVPSAVLPSPRRAQASNSAAAAEDEDEDDDDFMASLSDDDDDEDAGAAAQALIAKKNAEREAAKRAAKGGPTAKSSLILDIKPEDSETDMNELLTAVKQIEMDGLTWGGHEVRQQQKRTSPEPQPLPPSIHGTPRQCIVSI